MNNDQGVIAPKSVYDLTITLNTGQALSLSSLQGKRYCW